MADIVDTTNIRFREDDGDPSILSPGQVIVSNGSLTDNMDGTVSLVTGGGAAATTIPEQVYVTNGLLRSEEFDNAAWTSNEIASVTANAIQAPNGTTTADLVIPSTNLSGSHSLSQTISLGFSAFNVTLSVWAKAEFYDHIVLELGASGFPVPYQALFDLTNGAIVELGAGTVFNSPTLVANMEAFSNDWYRCSITAVNSSLSCRYSIHVSNGAALDEGTEGSTPWAGNGTGGVYLWGAQAQRASRATYYVATTSASAQDWGESANGGI